WGRAESPHSPGRREPGREPVIGHAPGHAEPGLELVASTAVKDSEPELTGAPERGASVLRRAPLLAEIASLRRVIAVGGAHGKTTTTAMVAAALDGCGLDPG